VFLQSGLTGGNIALASLYRRSLLPWRATTVEMDEISLWLGIKATNLAMGSWDSKITRAVQSLSHVFNRQSILPGEARDK